MPKKIVILNGSPRKNGNTASLTAAFKRGAEEAGHTVMEFFPAHMKINGCLGCWKGGKDAAHPCVQRDDMEKISPLQGSGHCRACVPALLLVHFRIFEKHV